MTRNILLTLEYDGTGFHGWQRQPAARTVQGELERVLSILCGCDIAVNGTSRTDAGAFRLPADRREKPPSEQYIPSMFAGTMKR